MLGSIYALIALGYTMVYGVLRLINFAHGDVYMVGAFIGLYAWRYLGLPSEEGQAQVVSTAGLLLMMLIAMVGAAALGVLIERVAYRPLRRAPRLTALITAIGVSMLLEYGGQLVFGTTKQDYPWLAGTVPSSIGSAAGGSSGISIDRVDVIILVIAVLLVVVLQIIVHGTRPGKAMRAVAFDREAASLMGINTDTIIALTFIVGSAFAGAAGVLVGVRNHYVEPLMGLTAGIKAFVAAVVGGIGSIPGAALGGLIMGLSEEAVRAFYPELADAVVFGVLILILVLRPCGLIGSQTAEKV
ncbi:MAG: branched-chain amino acid ABC transporter permease [Armatimonadetes bacterium]|nr:branched-chain amino acid ABC transporter permease [Armatimonadota bacterium]